MPSVPEQLAAAAKAHFESQFQLLNTLTGKAFEGMEKVIELNMNAAKTSLDEATGAAREVGAATDPQALLSASAAQLQPNAEKALDYNRRLAEIGDDIYAEFSKVAEEQVAESRKKLQALIDEAEKNAPAGSENAIAAMKAILGNADASYDQVMRSARQAVDVLRNNMTMTGERFAQAAEEAVKPRAK